MGWIKIVGLWIHFSQKKIIEYEKFIEEIIAKRGNTETYCGGLIGCAIGFKKTNLNEYIEKMMKCFVLKSKNSRDPLEIEKYTIEIVPKVFNKKIFFLKILL